MATVVRDGFDLTDPDILADRLPLDEYAYLRENAPVFWNAQRPEHSGHDDGGFWALTRYDDVKAVSTARGGWSVEKDSAFVRLLDQSETARDTTKELLLCMDPPRHTRVRAVATRCFTPPRWPNWKRIYAIGRHASSGRPHARIRATSSPTSPVTSRCKRSPA